MDYDFSGPLQPQDLFGIEYVTMGGVIDHHLTTTVQSHTKMPKKPVVTTNNGLFPVLAANVQNQQNSRFIVSLYHPVVVLRPGRPEVRIPSVAPRAAPYGGLLFLFLQILRGSKRRDSNSPCPAAWRIPSGTLKKRIAMYFCNALFGLMLFWFQNHFPLSGKMILLTKKKMTIDTPPFKTVVPML